MGWKTSGAILLAVALGIGLFKNQIVSLFAGAGQAVGESLGGAIGSIPGAVAKGAGEAGGEWWKGIGDFLMQGGAAGQYFRERQKQESKQLVPFSTLVLGGSQPTPSDETITPYNREFNDVIVQKYEASGNITARATAAAIRAGAPPAYFAAASAAFTRAMASGNGPHAQRARAATEMAGGNDLSLFYALKAQGYSQAEAIRKMREIKQQALGF